MLIAFVAAYVLLLEVTIVRATNTGFANSGAAISPVQWSNGPEASYCADALLPQLLAGSLIGALAIILIAGGALLVARNPR